MRRAPKEENERKVAKSRTEQATMPLLSMMHTIGLPHSGTHGRSHFILRPKKSTKVLLMSTDLAGSRAHYSQSRHSVTICFFQKKRVENLRLLKNHLVVEVDASVIPHHCSSPYVGAKRKRHKIHVPVVVTSVGKHKDGTHERGCEHWQRTHKLKRDRMTAMRRT